jgi:hypothetical protein
MDIHVTGWQISGEDVARAIAAPADQVPKLTTEHWLRCLFSVRPIDASRMVSGDSTSSGCGMLNPAGFYAVLAFLLRVSQG